MHIHHDHIGSHTHAQTTPKGTEEVKTLLAYMIHHNDHHNEELADLLDSLPELSRKKLMVAIGSFEAANVELQEVLDSLQ